MFSIDLIVLNVDNLFAVAAKLLAENFSLLQY